MSWTHRALLVSSLDSHFLAHLSLFQHPNCHYMLPSLLPSSPIIVSFLPLQCCHSLGWYSDWRLQTGHSDSSPTLSNTSSLTRVILLPVPSLWAGTSPLPTKSKLLNSGLWGPLWTVIMPGLPLPLALFAQPNRTHFWFSQHLSRVSSGVISSLKPFLTRCVV